MPANTGLAKDVDALRKEVEELRNSLSHFNDLFEAIKQKQEFLQNENKVLQQRNDVLSQRVADLEQYSRQNNVEIKGVPTTKGEDCIAVLQRIGESAGCAIIAADIDVVHRVPTKNGPDEKNIISRFHSRVKKAEFANKAKKARLTTSAIGFSARQERPVFVNDHLTAENKRLFAQALSLKKEKKWQFLWIDNCQIKARKKPDSRVFCISKLSDLSVFS